VSDSRARHIYSAPNASPRKAEPMQSNRSPQRGTNLSQSTGNNVTVDSATLHQLLDRLDKLEGNMTGASSGTDARVSNLEKTLEAMVHKMEATNTELQDTKRTNIHLSNQVSRQGGLIEVLQQDIDARRSVVSRMDSWARQGEVWRDDMENQMNSMNRQIKECKNLIHNQQTSMTDVPSKTEMDQLKDRLNVMTQQTVAASLSVWHDKIDSSVRQVERQVAALRIGRTLGSSSSNATGKGTDTDTGANMSDYEVQEALKTEQPSELLVKGMIDTALRSMEKDLENTINGHVNIQMRNEQLAMMTTLRDEAKATISNIASECGLISDTTDISGNDIARRNISSKRALEREVESLVRKHEDVSSALMVLQEGLNASEKHRSIEHRGLERKMDETIAVSTSHVASIQGRCGALEDLIRNSELTHRTTMQTNKDDVKERVREATSGWADDRAALDRRRYATRSILSFIKRKITVNKNTMNLFARIRIRPPITPSIGAILLAYA